MRRREVEVRQRRRAQMVLATPHPTATKKYRTNKPNKGPACKRGARRASAPSRTMLSLNTAASKKPALTK